MTSSDLIDPSEYEDQPRNESEWRRKVWDRLARIEKQTRLTNGRVSRLERMAWATGGGLAVGVVLVAPIFLALVNR